MAFYLAVTKIIINFVTDKRNNIINHLGQGGNL